MWFGMVATVGLAVALSKLRDPRVWGLDHRATPLSSFGARVWYLITLSEYPWSHRLQLHWHNDVQCLVCFRVFNQRAAVRIVYGQLDLRTTHNVEDIL